MNEKLVSKARLYAAARQLELAEELGSGKDGIVWVAKYKSKPANVAIKVLCSEERYRCEKEVYRRLQELAISIVLGFNVPQFIAFDDDLLTIEMTIVKRPFVLDFAGAQLDARPEFSDDIWTDWETEKKEQFEG